MSVHSSSSGFELERGVLTNSIVDEYEKQTGTSIPIHGALGMFNMLGDFFPNRSQSDSRRGIWRICGTLCIP